MILSNSYAKLPPEIVIEVDTKADFEQFSSAGGYFYSKSEALLNFGVKKVIWIFTDARKVMIAEADQDWLIHGWDKDIEVLDGKTLNLSRIIK